MVTPAPPRQLCGCTLKNVIRIKCGLKKFIGMGTNNEKKTKK